MLVLLGFTGLSWAQSAPFWRDVEERSVPQWGVRHLFPAQARVLQLDAALLENLLALAPPEGARLEGVAARVRLPLPDGGILDFAFVESPVMEPELARAFPEIRSFRGQGLQDALASVRFDWSPLGFHAMMRTMEGTVFIDPFQQGDREYVLCYWKDHARPIAGNEWLCGTYGEQGGLKGRGGVTLGDELRTYRAAIATTGEYTQFHGGTVALGLAAVNTALNRVNEVYEVDVAIRMVLVANNASIIYTNPSTDPYTNNNPSALLSQNQSNLDAGIGSANYDIGHVFSTGGGGLASLGVVCLNGLKARGETGLGSPIGDPFYIDYVAHEMGHQWGANHTFNGTTSNCGGGNRNPGTAFEPGSGSTIMAYAGICGAENLQPNSDPYFHAGSFDEIVEYSRNDAGDTCDVPSATGNQAPTVSAPPARTLPISTPFELTASASDPDGHPLSYCWEQMDLGTATPPQGDNGNRPLFRSFNPGSSPTRTFPKWSDILNNISTFGEWLPTTTRTLTFRVTVRDNRSGGGGVASDTTTLSTTSTAGPFLVTAPNSAVTWNCNQQQTVSWNVASTQAPPVSASTVDILLSVDGGTTFPFVLATGTANDGSAEVSLPNEPTTTARIKVKASDNYFFDLSNTPFTIECSALCTTDWANWLAASSGGFLDHNGNGLVDVIDYIECNFP